MSLFHRHHPDRYDDAAAQNADADHERVQYNGFRMLWGVAAAGLILVGITLLSRSNPDIKKYRDAHPPVARKL